MDKNVQDVKSNGKKSLADFLKSEDYKELKDKIKFDILSDPRLHTLHELYLLFEKFDSRLSRIETKLLELGVNRQ